MKILTRSDKVLILVVLGLIGVLGIFYYFFAKDGRTAVVEIDGYEIKRIALPNKFVERIQSKDGYIKIEVNGNRVRIIESSCPNKICVKTGWIENTSHVIICLPNRAVVKITDGAEKKLDGISK